MYDDEEGQGEFEFEDEPVGNGNGRKRKPRRSLREAFEEFDAAHPEVFIYLVALCFEVYRKGRVHYGIGAFWERMRWHFAIEKDLGDDFKLNNNHRAYYARKLMATHPELEGFFELRELKSE